MHEPAELAASYWEFYRLSMSQLRAERLRADELSWAAEEIDAAVLDHPEMAVDVLVIIADAAPDDAALAFLGAGPIENLLHWSVSAAVVDRVESAAAQNESFRRALRCTWFENSVSAAIAQRLRRFGNPY